MNNLKLIGFICTRKSIILIQMVKTEINYPFMCFSVLMLRLEREDLHEYLEIQKADSGDDLKACQS